MKLEIKDKKTLLEIGKYNKWIFNFASDELKEDRDVIEKASNSEEYKKIEDDTSDKGTFVVVSDFHSNKWPVEEKIPKYLEEYDKVYILGDTTDRGSNESYNEGEGGVNLLLDIMDKCKKYPDRLIYVPGNHDEFLYYYAAHEDTDLGQFMKNNTIANHGYYTIEELDNLRQNDPRRLQELIDWLGKLPVQKVHVNNGQRYCLAHAFFNEKIYRENPNYSLEEMFKDNMSRGYDPYGRREQILWFRKGEAYDVTDVPVNSIVVIGHTPIQSRIDENLDLQNYRGEKVKVICVDGGIAYQADNREMYKYVSGYERESGTLKDEHFYKPNRGAQYEELYTEEEYNLFIEAINTTAKKHGIVQIIYLIVDYIYNNREDWYAPITNDNNLRDKIKNIDVDKIKLMIEKSNIKKENDTVKIAEQFIISLTKENETFNQIFETNNIFTISEEKKLDETQPIEKHIEPETDDQFEIEKQKIMKARFSDEVKEELIKQLEEEYFGTQGPRKR